MICSRFIFDHIIGEINSTHGNDIRATSDILIVPAFVGAVFWVGISSTLDRCTMECQQTFLASLPRKDSLKPKNINIVIACMHLSNVMYQEPKLPFLK
jgi:hypothetical protein